MDSGNSGSLQSSSGGDEEYDSVSGGADHSSSLMASFSSTLQPPTASSAAAFFGDPNLSSSTTYLNFNNIMIPQLPNYLPSSSTHDHHLHLDPDAVLNHTRSIPPPSTAAAAPSSSGQAGAGVGGVVTKNPKKRTRASRRAPTTVLTTDTTNFRAMVQEFTGVPAPPFSTGHSYSSGRRFDIFRSPAPPPSCSGHLLDSLYNPFRPTAQKVQSLIPSSSSSMLNHQMTVDSSNIATSMASPTMNFHYFPDLPLPKLPLETQNTQVPTFQSLMSQQHHQHHHQTVSSLHELNSMNLGALRQDHNLRVSTNDGDVSRDDRDHDHRLIIRQFDVPLSSAALPEFDRREKGSENYSNISSSSSSIKGTNTATTTTVDHPWICPTD